MVPSDETIDKVLQPFYWVKDRVKQSMEDGFLSPFPKFKDANPEWTDILKDYLIDFDANSIDKGKYPFFVEKMLMISDFLKKDSMDIFMSYDRFQN